MQPVQHDLRLSGAKDNSIPHAIAAEPRRIHSTVICRLCGQRAQKNCNALYCRTHRWDAPVPMHKVSQHMQNKIAQRQQRREKVIWRPQFRCARNPRQIQRQSSDARTRRASEPTFLRNGTSVYPKNNVLRRSYHSNHILDVAVPMRSAHRDVQNTIRIARLY